MNIPSILGLIAAPVGIIIGVIVKGIFDRRVSKDTTDVAIRTGHTQEIEVAFEGLTANINSLQEQLKDLRTELRDSKTDARRTVDDLGTTQRDLRRLEGVVSNLRVERAAFLVHISALEALIPSPPGAPARPVWMIPEVHSDDETA